MIDLDRHADRPAMTLVNTIVTYADLSRRTQAGSALLKARAIRSGDRVAILSESRPEWATTFFAAMRSGAVVVPLDIKWTPEELAAVLLDAGPRILFASPALADTAALLKSRVPALEHVVRMDAPPEPGMSAPGFVRSPDDTALIIYTSGTTGNPKGVMITHRNLAFQIDALKSVMDIGPQDAFLSILPMNHLLEFTCGFLGVLHVGGTIHYSHSMRPDEIVRAVTERRITHMVTVPLFLKMLGGYIAAGRMEWPRTFRSFICGGAPLEPGVAEFFGRMGIPVYQGYGLTETSPVITVNTPAHNRVGSAGRPLDGTEIRIAGDGEILTRGPHVMRGYYKRDDLTREAIDPDGWFHTGDLGRLDPDGFLHITGRKKNLIVLASGKKVHPEEVEAVLSRARTIKEVCVVGSDEVCAVAVPSDELVRRRPEEMEEEIRNEVKSLAQDMAAYKRPTKILIHSDEFPKTATRKVKRLLVSEWVKQHKDHGQTSRAS